MPEDKTILDDEKIRVNDCPYIHDVVVEPKLEIRQFGEGVYAMMCMRCGSVGPMSYSIEEAIKRWNNRTFVVIDKENYERLLNESETEGKGKEKVGESGEESSENTEKEHKDSQKHKETE